MGTLNYFVPCFPLTQLQKRMEKKGGGRELIICKLNYLGLENLSSALTPHRAGTDVPQNALPDLSTVLFVHAGNKNQNFLCSLHLLFDDLGYLLGDSSETTDPNYSYFDNLLKETNIYMKWNDKIIIPSKRKVIICCSLLSLLKYLVVFH